MMTSVKFIRPSEIMFNQDSISDHFQDGNSIEETLDDIKYGSLSVSDIPNITVYKRGHDWVTKNNRRLWVFRNLEESRRCSSVPVLVDHHCDKGNYRTDTVRVRGSGGLTAGLMQVYNGNDSPEEIDESLQALGTAGKVVAGIGIAVLFGGLALKVVSDIARNRRDN